MARYTSSLANCFAQFSGGNCFGNTRSLRILKSGNVSYFISYHLNVKCQNIKYINFNYTPELRFLEIRNGHAIDFRMIKEKKDKYFF